jgi:uncharacterized membrane protein
MVAALITAPLIRWLDQQTQWMLLGFGRDGAVGLMGALTSSLLTFIIFAFSILILAVQMGSGQLSPRLIARIFEEPLTKATLGAFVYAWTFAVTVLGRIEDRVPQLPLALAILMSLVSIGLFFYLVQAAIYRLRPISVMTSIAQRTQAVITEMYPEPWSASADSVPPLGPSAQVITFPGPSGAILSFHIERLVEIGAQAGCVIEIVPEVGDYLATGERLFRLYGAGVDAVDPGALVDCVEVGPERTLEQDPAFGFRIIVDIASKALSPAINDPTTGVLAIDQLQNLLLLLGQRQLDNGCIRDSTGTLRLIQRTPGWNDFVTLASMEIRLYGASSPQVTRRLQAMFEQLIRQLPPERAGILNEEVAALERTVGHTYADPRDQMLAIQGDPQGFGSHRSAGEA